MRGFLNPGGAVSLALHATAFLAARDDTPVKTSEIAEDMQVSEAHLAKVLQQLSRAGLVTARPGPRGGYRLARDAEGITLLEVYEAIVGKMRSKTCLFEEAVCAGTGCILGSALREADEIIRERLESTRLSDLKDVFSTTRTSRTG